MNVERKRIEELQRENAALRKTAHEAVRFICVIGEELWRNGYPPGDRATILANLRRLIAEKKADEEA